MTRFVLTRLVLLVIGLFVASALIFTTLRVLPGDVAQVIAGTDSTPEQVQAIRVSLGLDRPLPAQYVDWIGGILHGDLGRSMLTGSSVTDQLLQKAQVTVPLALLSLLIALVISIPLGILSAIKHRGAAGAAMSMSSQAIAAIPVVWAGMILVAVFAVTLHWFPPQGFPRAGWDEPARALYALLLPALTIGVVEGAVLLRFIRSAALEAMGQDYVRTAAAKGLTRTRALITHGLPNVALTVVSVLALQIAGLLVGAVIIEQLFNLPGIGRMLVADVGNRDLEKVQGEILAMTGLVLVIGTAVDILARVIDPRQRESAA
ncbi:peptide/nickel transport system permease protein [Paramicrobacterium humi]|uniref:Peptide/nickel transport system permease protein n=1 Tax=Paramicrobacterium humi TaxID=640635 RepID=A0A1H4P8B0_9MICO|nr:ABC transporter permease [Microbacterium humi]SEC03696.1 peptide/nickel transport system permease protein [Microbacterium humi]